MQPCQVLRVGRKSVPRSVFCAMSTSAERVARRAAERVEALGESLRTSAEWAARESSWSQPVASSSRARVPGWLCHCHAELMVQATDVPRPARV
eukprot:COSAG03_NODE_1588_length_3824_cov_3.751744_6_plen_94_part_00